MQSNYENKFKFSLVRLTANTKTKLQEMQVQGVGEIVQHDISSGANPEYIAGTVDFLSAVKGEDNSVYVEADALNSYFQNLNDAQTEKVENLLGVTKEEVAEAAANGMEVTTTMGGLRGAATATNGALFEAVKDKVSFDVDDNSLSDLKTKQETIKDYREAERLENELNVELDKIRESMISAGVKTSVANYMTEIHRAAAIGANPENPAEYFKRNPIRYVKGQNGEVQEQAYNMVTNEKLTADTLVPIVDVTGIDIPNVKGDKNKKELIKNLVGIHFNINGSNGQGFFENIDDGKHFVNSSLKNKEHRLNPTRLRSLKKLEDIFKSAIYVNKHTDKKGTDKKFIELYVPIKDGNDIICFRINAFETNNKTGTYEIKEINFYDFIKEKPADIGRSSLNDDTIFKPDSAGNLEIRLADLLKDVKDEKGLNYVDANGNLNYEFGALKLLGNNQSYNQEADLYTPEAREQMEAVRKKYEGTKQWMKAPNGEPTKLTEEQWILVRTPNFKRWFGDWENVTSHNALRKAYTFNETKEVAQVFIGKELFNSKLGIKVTISNRNIDKMKSGKATSESAYSKLQIRAIANVDKLFLNADAEYKHHDKNNDPNIKYMHRLFSPFIVDGEPYVAKLTVKEFANVKEGIRVYSVEALEIKNASRKWNAAYEEDKSPLTPFPQEAFDNSINELLEKVNTCSKVLDENGEPLVVYHGTNEKFDTFDTRKTNTPQFWLTDRKDLIDKGEVGARGKGIIMPVFLNIKKYAGWKEEDNFGLEQIKARGFDGKILLDDGVGFYVVFNSNQAKSATANNGNFSLADNNIYQQQDLGAISWDEAGRATISLFQNSDESTIIHESGHLYFQAR